MPGMWDDILTGKTVSFQLPSLLKENGSLATFAPTEYSTRENIVYSIIDYLDTNLTGNQKIIIVDAFQKTLNYFNKVTDWKGLEQNITNELINFTQKEINKFLHKNNTVQPWGQLNIN